MKFLKFLLPLLVLGGAIATGKYLVETGPEAKKKPFVERLPVVEVLALKQQDYSVNLRASGLVRAGTETNIVSEVSGRIIKLNPTFNEGAYFKKNQTLLTIDSSNYENALAIVSSDVEGSKASLSQLIEEEKSTRRSYNLAKKNLKLGKLEVSRLHKLWLKKLIARSQVDAEEQKVNQLQQRLEESQGKLNTFKSRQLAVKSKINAALSRQKQERLNLSRTTIKTPYEGRVLQKNVDVGQFVGVGAGLGKIVSTDFVYVDLPLSLNQYELLGIAETFQNKVSDKQVLPNVTFSSTTSHKKSTWEGKVVRTGAALDADSRQIKVIARIDEPFIAKKGVNSPIRIGQYLDGAIKGKTFKNIFVLASSAVRQNKEILLLKEGKVHIVLIDVLFNTSKVTVVKASEKIAGEKLITTSLSQATEGMKVITLQEQRKILQKKHKKEKEKKEKQKQQEKQSRQLNNDFQSIFQHQLMS